MNQLGSHSVEMEAVPLCGLSLLVPNSCLPGAQPATTACDSESAAQPYPQAGIFSHHLEGSKIKGSCLILLQSSLSISIRVSSVRAHSTHLWKNMPI